MHRRRRRAPRASRRASRTTCPQSGTVAIPRYRPPTVRRRRAVSRAQALDSDGVVVTNTSRTGAEDSARRTSRTMRSTARSTGVSRSSGGRSSSAARLAAWRSGARPGKDSAIARSMATASASEVQVSHERIASPWRRVARRAAVGARRHARPRADDRCRRLGPHPRRTRALEGARCARRRSRRSPSGA